LHDKKIREKTKQTGALFHLIQRCRTSNGENGDASWAKQALYKKGDKQTRFSSKSVRKNEITLERINSVWTGQHSDKTLLCNRTKATQNAALAQRQALTDTVQKVVRRVHARGVAG
jgi:hypothetical protein